MCTLVKQGREREGAREGGREERERLHLLDAPALGSLPTSVSRDGVARGVEGRDAECIQKTKK